MRMIGAAFYRYRLMICTITAISTGSACRTKHKTHDDAAPPLPPADAATPPVAGKVYFAVSREGVIELKGGTFTRVIRSQGRIDDLAVAAEGQVFAVSDAQIIRASPLGGEPIGDRRAPGLVRRIAAAPDDSLWALGGKGLWRFANDIWTRDETFPRPRTVVDVAATQRGIVVAARDTAFIQDADHAWLAVPLPPPPPRPTNPTHNKDSTSGQDVGDSDDDGVDEDSGNSHARRTWIRQLVSGADGQLYASTSRGIFRLDDLAWTRVSDTPVSTLSVGRNGTLVAAAESGGIVLGKPGAFEERELASFGMAATELDAIATDALGRIWLATDGGLILARGNGDPITAWSAGSQVALPGRIVSIYVEVAPTILPSRLPRRFGTIEGTLVDVASNQNKKTTSGLTVEICARPDTLFRGSPCAEAAFRGAARIDDNGHFLIDEVPAGRYGFAVQKDDEWVVDLTIDCCTQLFETDRVSIGKVSIAGD